MNIFKYDNFDRFVNIIIVKFLIQILNNVLNFFN